MCVAVFSSLNLCLLHIILECSEQATYTYMHGIVFVFQLQLYLSFYYSYLSFNYILMHVVEFSSHAQAQTGIVAPLGTIKTNIYKWHLSSGFMPVLHVWVGTRRS